MSTASLLLWVVIGVLASGNLSQAQQTSSDNLDELMQGFDDPASDVPATELDELMQGFEDDPNSAAPAQPALDNPEMQELLEGFEDSSDTKKSAASPTKPSRWWDWGGYMTLSSSYNYQHQSPPPGEADFRGLSRFRYKIQPELKVDLPHQWDIFVSANAFYDAAFSFNGRRQYRSSYLKKYERELELRDLYVQGSLNAQWDIKIGRQIVVWGKSDTIRVVDVLNPLDFREPGMVDIEDLRLPVTMVKADYYFNEWNFSTLLIPEIRGDKLPAYGSDFYPSPFPPLHKDRPNNGLDNLEYAVALSGIFSGWDLSFHYASVYEDQPHLKKRPSANNDNGMEQAFSRLTLLGTAANFAIGNWLIKGELAVIRGFQFFATDEATFSRNDMMLGFDYSGFTDTTLSLEGVLRHLNNFTDALSILPDDTEQDSGQLAFRYTGNFQRETLQAVFLASIFGSKGEQGAFYRASIKYIPKDALSMTAGIIVYASGENRLLKQIADNDRLFGEIRYDF